MEAWIAENPKTSAYILYLSVVVVLVSIIALYYYTKAQEHIIQPKKVILKEAPITEKNDSQIEEKDGFTIINN